MSEVESRKDNECITDNIVLIQQRLMALQRECQVLADALSMHRDCVGKAECLSIIKTHINVSEVDDKLKRLQESTARVSHLPLICFADEDGNRYDVVLARMNKLVVGEYENIEDVMAKMSTDKALSLRSNVNAMEERLLANSVEVYKSLNTKAKFAGRNGMLNGLIVSEKRKYLYRYHHDRKHVLSFVAIRQPKHAEP